METIIQQLSTFITLLFNKNINTGDRILDNTLIGILSILCIKIIKDLIIEWRAYYNCIIFHLYGMKNHPLDLWKAPYSYNFVYLKNDEFFKNHKQYNMGAALYSHIELWSKWCNYTTQIMGPLIKKTKIIYLANENGNAVISDDINIWKKNRIDYNTMDSGLYIIAIDKYGYPIYYGTDGCLYFQNRNAYLEIEPHFASYWIQEYEKLIININVSNGIYVMKFGAVQSDTKLEKIGIISSKKTFDTLFYTQKEELLNILEKFKKGEMYPGHIPMDNKLGIMLYGPPGTGKTGTISAIANYLKRNITIVNLTEITKVEQLEKILDPRRYKETIFVLDEFDCIMDVLGKNTEDDSTKNDWASMLMMAEGDERKQILDMMRNGRKAIKQGLNMAYLLQKLDGLESAEGRVIIATTNNPDKINPALLRPGRFDLKLCLGNCTQDMYCKILENFYKNEKDVCKRVLKAKIPEMKYSPLELMNMSMQSNNLDQLLEKILV